jgi:O-methyltransferase
MSSVRGCNTIQHMKCRMTPKKRIAALLFPRYSLFVEKLQWNAKWIATVKETADIPLFQTREELHRFVQSRTVGPVDYMEFGVYTGASLRLWCESNTETDSRFFGFDSFEGLPEDFSPRFPKGAFSTGGSIPDIRDPRVHLVVGWFQKTLPKFLDSYEGRDCPFVIHCDSDLYSSALFCLASLNRIIHPGTTIIFDDLSAVTCEYRALTDYAAAFLRQWRFIAATEGFEQAAVEITE